MRNLLFIILSTTITFAQTAFYNDASGNIQLHDNAKIGFHTDLENNGTFDTSNNYKGLAGFYNDTKTLTVSGTEKITFYDVEIDVANDLELQKSLALTNELSFINGKVITDKNNLTISLEFNKHNFYAGENDENHINGYATVIGKNDFTFPIGDGDRLRPMILPIQNTATTFLGAYFFEDPNMLSTFSGSALTNDKEDFIDIISKKEFWDLNGDSATSVTLTWDNFSDIGTLSDDSQKLRIVGWSILENKWRDLGAKNLTGDLTKGTLTSDVFIPDNYEIITIASGFADSNSNYVNLLISPNGDTKNETLVFKNLKKYNTNRLEIFNRWGNTIYKTDNYNNDWNGISTGRATVISKEKLPAGTYFYILKYGINNLSKTQKGWVYINR
ncbi:gliding motility-associated C-terminal domain-containing protein [Tenacibaculum piscium]|uniref:gliding motility-associated C-terminal domain-containing protein n=1 Tax=Tenacibaculum piscium TaxID=1458515 RepID=UPI00187B74A0|nr:gliding motility-associated C-terminal domain-containing protein [Tenacibaculum piscium]MBE7691122.1 T9SS type B sorting domain-containing protein [Tenacibaculum piscium]